MKNQPGTATLSTSEKPNNDGESAELSAFSSFTTLCEQTLSALRKAEKSALISRYLNTLQQDELVVAARCLSGYVFPLREHLTLNVSGLIIINCLAACTGVTPSFVKERLCSVGDLGDLALEIIQSGLTISVSERLTLVNVATVVTQVSGITGTRRKSELITRLLRMSTPIEAKYLVRIMTGDLGIGLTESDVEDALSRWKDVELARVQSANMLLGDIGETALLCANGKIDEARMRLYDPIKYMHSKELTTKDDLARLLPERFIIEDKLDGIRVQVHVGLDVPGSDNSKGATHDGLRVVIFSDNFEDITANFLDLLPGLAALVPEQAGTVDTIGVIYDGEIVASSNQTFLPVKHLRARFAPKADDTGDTDTGAVGFVAFDQLFHDGRSLIQEEWLRRRSGLEKTTFDKSSTFRIRSTNASSLREVESALDEAIIRGSLGVVIKDPRSCYRPGRRSSEWIEILPHVEMPNDGRAK